MDDKSKKLVEPPVPDPLASPAAEPPEGESLERPDPPETPAPSATPEPGITPDSPPIIESQALSPFPLSDHPAEAGAHPPRRKRLRFVANRTLITAGIFLLAVALLVGGAFFLRPKPKPDQTVIINTQNLDNGTLNKLAPQGGAATQLTINANILAVNDLKVQGTASVQRDMTVRGNLTVNGTTNLQATTINGGLTVNSGLAVNGNSSLSGNLSVTGLLTTGGLSVGSITTSSLTVNNNLTLGGHLIPTGSAPSISPGPAARGGSVSISGNDTAGTITINTGNQGLGGAHTGEMAVITFRTPFATTPKIQLTPINIDAAGLNYYAARGPRFFNVNSTSTVADGTTYVFDYLVTQ